MKRAVVALLIVSMVMAFSTVAFAENKADATKLKRGANNVALGWTEIPKTIMDTSKKSNFIVGVTAGTIKGVLNAFARTASGVVDLATFPVGNKDKPVIKPSMVNNGDTK